MQNFGPMSRQWWTTGITRNWASFLKLKDLYKMMSWPKHKAGPTVLWTTHSRLDSAFLPPTWKTINLPIVGGSWLRAETKPRQEPLWWAVWRRNCFVEKGCNVSIFKKHICQMLVAKNPMALHRKCIKLVGVWWTRPWLRYVPHGAITCRAVRPLETWVPCHDIKYQDHLSWLFYWNVKLCDFNFISRWPHCRCRHQRETWCSPSTMACNHLSRAEQRSSPWELWMHCGAVQPHDPGGP